MALVDLDGLRRFKLRLDETFGRDISAMQSVIGETAMQTNASTVTGAVAELKDAKINKPSSAPNGTAGQFLQTNGDGTTTWVTIPTSSDSQSSSTTPSPVIVQDMPEDAKLAILQLASKVVYTDDGGEDYYNALYNAFYGNAPVPSSITAAFTPGSRSFVLGTSLSELKQYLVVTATYSDGTTMNVTSYSLNGALAIGENTVTVNYGNQTATFVVTISSELPVGYTQLEYINTADGYADTGLTETEVARAEYRVQVSAVYYTKGNHILSAMNTFFPYLSGSNAGGDYSQIRAKLKGSETVSAGTASYEWSRDTTYTLEGFVGNSNDVILNGDNKFSITAGNAVSSSYTFLLFATQVNPSDNGYRFHGRLYYMKIYDANGNMLRNYIPCKNSSNVVGLYDTVTQTFLSSANQQSAFIAGPVA